MLPDVTGPWIVRTKEPSTQPKKWLPVVREVDKGRAPPLVLPELLQEAYACVGRIKGGDEQAKWNQSAFHQVREERRSYLTSADCPREWRPPQEHDIHFGPLTLPNGEINVAGAEYSSVPTRAMIVSGFPVGPDYIWACMHYLAGPPNKLAATAVVLDDLLRTFLPGAAKYLGWMDVISTPRHHRLAPNLADAAEGKTSIEADSFDLSMEMIDKSGVEILLVTQKDNHIRFLRQLPPSHVRLGVPGPTATHGKDESIGALDHLWIWAPEQKGKGINTQQLKARKITPLEIKLWAEMNVVDMSSRLPFSPTAIFVRRWQGGSSRIVYFLPHPCVLNEAAFPSTFYPAVDEFERCFLSLASLFKRSLEPEGVATANSWVEAKLQDRATSFQEGLKLIKTASLFHGSSSPNTSLVEAVKQLRVREKNSGRATPAEELEPKLREYIAQRLIPDQPTSALSSLQPQPTSTPTSILGHFLSYLSTTATLTGLARIEALDPASRSPVEAAALGRARECTVWRVRLERDIGLAADELDSDTRFAQALVLRTRQQQENVSLLTIAKTSIGNAKTSRWLHLWTAHGEGQGALAEKRLTMGRIRSAESESSGRVTVGPPENLTHWWPGSAPCLDCVGLGLPACYLPYGEAVAEGWVAGMVGAETALAGLKGWIEGWEVYKKEEKAEEYKKLLSGAEEAAHALDGLA